MISIPGNVERANSAKDKDSEIRKERDELIDGLENGGYDPIMGAEGKDTFEAYVESDPSSQRNGCF